MTKDHAPSRTYHDISKRYPEVIAALENLGTTVRGIGPLDEKTGQLIQLAAAAATKSEGSVHSHTRRAIKSRCYPGRDLSRFAAAYFDRWFPSGYGCYFLVSGYFGG